MPAGAPTGRATVAAMASRARPRRPRTGPLRSSRAVAAVAAAVALALTAGLTTACSSGSPSVDPSTAAQTLASVYKLDPAQQRCLKVAFAADHGATLPLAANKAATNAQLAALGRVARGCIPTSTLATAIVGGANQSVALTGTQQSCLRMAVARLSDADRATLLADLAVPTALSDLQTALLGRVTDGLLNTCRITLPGVVTDTTG